jgi:hypothetical protein
MAAKKERQPEPKFEPETIRDISEAIYRIRLEQDCHGNVAGMLAKDLEKDPNDGGKKLRNRASSYDPLTRVYLEVLGFKPGKVELPLAVAGILKGVKPA